MGHVNRKKALEVQRNADLLLLLESSNEDHEEFSQERFLSI